MDDARPLSEPAKEDTSSVTHATGAAMRRRQRRLRHFLRHERLTVAMLLAEREREHLISPRGPKPARPSLGRRSGYRGTPWSSLLTSLPWYRLSMYLCPNCGPTGGRAQALRCRDPRAGYRSAQDLSPIPSSSRGFAATQMAEQLVEVPTDVLDR